MFNYKSVLLILIISCLTVGQLPAQERNSDPWMQFSFLLGDWAGTGSGKPGDITSGSTSFSFDLDKNVLVRKNRAEFAPKQQGEAGIVHQDLMVIYRQPGEQKFLAIYFDNEGHVINYHITPQTEKSQIVFESDAMDNSPQFRVIYQSGLDGSLTNEFQIAPPGGEFRTYTKGIITKIKQ